MKQIQSLFSRARVACVLLAATIGLATVAPPAAAQVPTSSFQAFSLPAVIAATTVSNLPTSQQIVIDCTKMQNVALEWYFTTTTPGTATNYALVFNRSSSGVLYETNNPIVVLRTGSGAIGGASGTNVVGTNILVAGFRYLKLIAVTNGDAGNMTNNPGSGYSLKINCP